MKKILIATTALIATAGVAAADVAVSGNGRMGVVYNGEDLNFSSRLRIVFTASGETDGGLQFGGSIRADNATAAKDGLAGNIYISGAFGKLAMGDTVGAAEELIGDLPEIGFQDLSTQVGLDNDIGYITGDNAGNPVLGGLNTGSHALYTYSTGGLKFALSMNDGKSGFLTTTQEYAVGVKYSMDAYSVALAYEVSDPAGGPSSKHLILGADATFADTTVKAFYGDGSGALSSFKQYGIGVTSKFDAITAKGYVKKTELGGVDITSWGLGGEYSLGGGATVAFGLSDDDVKIGGVSSKVTADFGVKFTF